MKTIIDNELETTVTALKQTFKQRIREWILQLLQCDRQPLTTADIAQATSLSVPAVQRAICDLIASDQLAHVGWAEGSMPTFRPIEIGSCEWCGRVSHRLVAGECPQHRAPVINTDF